MQSNIYTFIGFNKQFEEASAVLFGAPFDSTTSFKPGARFAPNAMREDSWAIESYSPYQDKDLEDLNLFDAGDLELPFGNGAKSLRVIEKFVDEVVKEGKIPIMIGGEHLVSFAPIQSLAKKYTNLHILHFDAHTDLREEYLGEKLSHASVMKRAWNVVGDGKIFQFCIRSGLKEEFEWAKSHTHLEKFGFHTLQSVVAKIKDKPVYITIDLDVLDPSVMPGTGTPEPGGITFNQLLEIINELKALENVVGFDLVELSPKYDISGISTAVACKTLREMTLAVVK